jgi:beta-glucanase (GH16 family)
MAVCLFFLCGDERVSAQNKPYKSGEIYTTQNFQYGKIEFRMLVATGSGVISNFFTFKNGSEQAGTYWEEVDVEVFGKNGAHSWQSNIITGQDNANLTHSEQVHQQNGLGQEYHTYSVQWKPNSITWTVDGVTVRTTTGGQANDVDEQTSLRFNLWNPDIPSWVGPFDESILPVHMYVNWIKFYPWNGTSFSSTPAFEDDFDFFDRSKWNKANWTFDLNQADFIPQNVNTEDGYLVLSLTNAGETGYQGTPPEDGPAFLLGDCNQDGVVGFLDIARFIEVLMTGDADLLEADCNQDRSVNFLDISPFIAILTGN